MHVINLMMIPFTNEERARLTKAAKPIGQNDLKDMPTIVTPDTLMKRCYELQNNLIVPRNGKRKQRGQVRS